MLHNIYAVMSHYRPYSLWLNGAIATAIKISQWRAAGDGSRKVPLAYSQTENGLGNAELVFVSGGSRCALWRAFVEHLVRIKT